MHKILMEDEAKPARDKQKRPNPIMQEVVEKEVKKLLDFGMIYVISDSQWVSLVQCAPKKGGITVKINEKNEVMAMRLVNSSRVCMDCRKFDKATRKDHFPLPFYGVQSNNNCPRRSAHDNFHLSHWHICIS